MPQGSEFGYPPTAFTTHHRRDISGSSILESDSAWLEDFLTADLPDVFLNPLGGLDDLLNPLHPTHITCEKTTGTEEDPLRALFQEVPLLPPTQPEGLPREPERYPRVEPAPLVLPPGDLAYCLEPASAVTPAGERRARLTRSSRASYVASAQAASDGFFPVTGTAADAVPERSEGAGGGRSQKSTGSLGVKKAAMKKEGKAKGARAAAAAEAEESQPVKNVSELRRINSTWRAKIAGIKAELDQVAEMKPGFAGLSALIPDLPTGWNSETTKMSFESWTQINNTVNKFTKVVGRCSGAIVVKNRDSYRGTVEDVTGFIQKLASAFEAANVLEL